MSFDKDDCLRFRGLAILIIVVHNFVHLLPGRFVQENEMYYYPGAADAVLKSISEFKPSMLGDVFSFFGWYGVAVFVFLSGFGLVKKYETEVGFYVWWRGFVHSVAKMLLLFIPAYVFYIGYVYVLSGEIPIASLGVLPIVANFSYPFCFPDPGVYWYVGLAVQLYLAYAVLRRLSEPHLWVLAVAGGVAVMAADPLLIGTQDLLAYMRSNCIAWIPLFACGMMVGRRSFQDRKLSVVALCLFLLAFALLTLLFSIEFHFWVLSVFPAVAFILCLALLISRLRVCARVLSWLGMYAACIFVIHPVVRYIFLQHLPETGLGIAFWTISGTFLSVIAAIGYSWYYLRVRLILSLQERKGGS